MEIRLLCGNELQWAVNTANEVFERCVRPYVRSNEETAQYYNYVRLEYLWQEMSAGRLLLWGAFENGQMCAVSAMQSVGHVTMLYVRPQYSGRHVAMRLLDEMCGYAASVLGRERVTIHVTPVASASFFYHVGFTTIQGAPLCNGYMPLERRIWSVPQGYQTYANGGYGRAAAGKAVYPGYTAYGNATGKQEKPVVTYPVKKLSAKTIVCTVLTVLALALAIVIGTTAHHIAVDGLKTETDYWNENPVDLTPEEFGEPEEI